MNKSGIEWCDHTWNPITGCRHGCSYCYADKMSLRFCGNMKRNMVQTDPVSYTHLVFRCEDYGNHS